MKVLFALHLFSHTRHFHTVFEELLARGHSLEVVGLNKLRGQGPTIRPPKHAEHIGPILYSRLPDPRGDYWGGYAEAIRASRNLLLYSHPNLKNATVFRERAATFADPFLTRFMPPEGPAPAWLNTFYRFAELAIPPDPVVESFLAERRPDVILVSPLIFNEMLMLHEFVKAANLLGIPVGFPVFSWDNLTTKGTVHELPDRVFVWNDIQREEAVELHHIPEARIEVLGGWRFDEFLTFRSNVDRAEFCAVHNFDPSQPIVIYIGSSPIIAPTETRFVSEWIKALRNSSKDILRRANILVRPHPRNLAAWRANVDFARQCGVSVEDVERLSLFETKGLYDAIHHSHAALGLVTSGMIEAALLRKPVHTVLTDVAGSGQAGTVHFDYLTTVGGGLLHVARSLDEHLSILEPHLKRSPGTADKRAENFVRAFVDPPGRTTTSTKALSDAIERLATISKLPRRTGLGSRLAQVVMKTVLSSGILPISKSGQGHSLDSGQFGPPRLPRIASLSGL